jgi:2'-5' RNA ligase
MIYSLVHYPDIDTSRINEFRRKYDPQFELIAPHVTLMFPIAESIGQETVVRHLNSVLADARPISLRLQGLQRSSDNYLFLLVDAGRESIRELQARIYTGVLSDFRDTSRSYVPHVTLGAFGDSADEYARAFDEAQRLELDYRSVLNKVHLLKVNDQRTQILSSREFSLM